MLNVFFVADDCGTRAVASGLVSSIAVRIWVVGFLIWLWLVFSGFQVCQLLSGWVSGVGALV